MSYNISSWRTKIIKDLRIPLFAFFDNSRRDWHPNKRYREDGSLDLVFIEAEISGVVSKETKNLHVTNIDMAGEGSGFDMEEIFKPALRQSTGYLEAVRIWECGDSIDRIVVKDGEISEEEILL